MKHILILILLGIISCLPNVYATNIDEQKAERIACGLLDQTQNGPIVWEYNSDGDYITKLDGEYIYLDDHAIRIYVEITRYRYSAVYISNDCQEQLYEFLENRYSELNKKTRQEAVDKYVDDLIRK